MIRLITMLIIFSTVACSSVGSEKQNSQTENDSYVLADVETFDKAVQNCDNIIILDVRTEKELKSGKLPCAVHIDFYRDDFKSAIAELDHEKDIYVYCHMGGRSKSAADIMIEEGFTKVYDLDGGIQNWKKADKELK